MNLLPGLHEALRLMALNDLDYAPGTIMKRIEQLESDVTAQDLGENTIEAELDYLKSELSQRDEQLRVALVEVEKWKEDARLLRVQCDVGDKSFQHQHEQLRELESQLRMAMSELGKIKSDFRALEEQSEAIAACAVMREALQRLLSSAREFSSDWRKGDFHLGELAKCDMQSMEDQFAEACDALSPTIGTDFLDRMRSLEVALGECVVALELVLNPPQEVTDLDNIDGMTAILENRDRVVTIAITHAQALLNERSK